MIGMLPGTELRLYCDSTIICKTVDDKNKVDFKGDITSLSDAAVQAFKVLGIDAQALSGPWEWTYNGKRLDEIRRQIEENAD